MSYPTASKVVVDGQVIQDLTEDTVTPQTLLRGVTAHNAVGNAITGSFDAEAYESALAIVIDGDEAPQNITVGQYLFIKNHSSLATGGYHATAAMSTGDTVSDQNTAADPDGFANSLSSNLSNNVFQEMEPVVSRCTVSSGGVAVVGKLAVINVKIHSAYAGTNTPSMLTLNSGIGTPKCITSLSCVKSTDTVGSMTGAIACHIGTNGRLFIQSVENDAYYDISGVVVLA